MIWNEIIEFIGYFFNDATGLTFAFSLTPYGPYSLFAGKDSNGDLQFKSIRFLGVNQQFWANDTGNEIQMIVGSLPPAGQQPQDIYFAQDLAGLALIPTGGLVIGDLAWVVSANSYYRWDGSAWIIYNQPTNVNSPILTRDLPTFLSEQSSGSLAVGYWYYITNVFIDPIWGYNWSVLTRATAIDRISTEVFATWNAGMLPTPTYPLTWVSSTLWSDTDPSVGIVFNECVGDMMSLTAAQANLYNAGGTKYLRENISVIVKVDDIFGNVGVRYETRVNELGLGIISSGRRVEATEYTDLWAFRFNSNIAWPTTPWRNKVQIDSSQILAGGSFQILPNAQSNWVWDILSVQYYYYFNTTAYTGNFFALIQSTLGTRQIAQTKIFDGSTADSSGYFESIDGSNDLIQWVSGDSIDVVIPSGLSSGDGFIEVFITAILREAF
jgi:hypothetical protein